MGLRNEQLDNCNSLLKTLPSDIQPTATDILTRINTLDYLLSEFEAVLPSCALLECTNDDGIIEYKPNPLIASYNSTVSTYNATVKELLDIKQKYVVEGTPIHERTRIQRVIACCGIIAVGVIAMLL